MPRRQRCVVEGLPHHATQRGVDRCSVFQFDLDRRTYLRLLGDNLAAAQVRLLGWCLMTNHVHLVVLPQLANSLALLLRRVHGRYAQYFHARAGRTGHLWQNRYFACPLAPAQAARALAYVDANPVRARMVESAVQYPWSSAAAHITGEDQAGLLDLAWWRTAGLRDDWQQRLRTTERDVELEQSTYAGRPFGDPQSVTTIGERLGRRWTRGRPPKQRADRIAQPGITQPGLLPFD
jgi:putative transposase